MENKKPSDLYVIPEANGDGYEIQERYKQLSQQKSILSDAVGLKPIYIPNPK